MSDKQKWWKELDDNAFWLLLWSLIATLVTSVLSYTVYGNIQRDKIVSELVIKGYDPLRLNCLYYHGDSNTEICRILYMDKLKDEIKNEVIHSIQQEPSKAP